MESINPIPPKKSTDIHTYLKLCIILCLLAGEFFYIYSTLARKELLGLGPDSFLVNMLLEHWSDHFSSGSPILTLRSFWPQQNTLGYSETMLGPGIIYSIIRIFCDDIYLSNNLCFTILHFTGIIFMYLTLREAGASRLIAFAGLLFSLWSCSFTQLSYHPQFFSLAFVPIFTFATLRFFKHKGSGWRSRFPWGLLASSAVGLTWLSSYYTAYFISLFFLILFVALLFYYCIRKELPVICRSAIKHIKEIIFYCILQLVWGIPLIIIYLPIFFNRSGYDRGFTLANSPMPLDILRTGSYAPVEAFLRNTLPFTAVAGYEKYLPNTLMETSYGWPVIVLLLFILCIPINIAIYKKKHDLFSFLTLSASFVIVIIYIAICRVGNASIWVNFRNLIPGASTIRAPGRAVAIYTIPMSIIICYTLSLIAPSIKKIRNYLPALLPVCLIIILITTSFSDHYTNSTTAERADWLSSVSTPPEECSVMILVPTLESNYNVYQINMDGWLIADKFNLKTINGYSGNFPENWDLLSSDITAYLTGVRNWVELNNITDNPGLYFYLVDYDTWLPYSEMMK